MATKLDSDGPPADPVISYRAAVTSVLGSPGPASSSTRASNPCSSRCRKASSDGSHSQPSSTPAKLR